MERFKCDDCGHICGQGDMDVTWPNIPHLGIRCKPGELIPGGECPQCRSLTHPVETQFGALIVFEKGVDKVEASRLLCSSIVCDAIVNKPIIHEFDPTVSIPLWYIP